MKRLKVILLLIILVTIICTSSLESNALSNNEKIEKSKNIKSSYSEIELQILEKKSKLITEKHPEITVISVEKIISNKMNFKFDTPPVIMECRTLVPVRAITESLGAKVTWSPSEKKVYIVKDTKKINLFIDNKKVLVNENEKSIDVPAKIINDRTYVPLRFIVEEFGLTINYDSKTEIIEIND